MAVRMIDFPSNEVPRVETGAVQFGTDWPGLFVRGDEACILAGRIAYLEPILKAVLESKMELANDPLTWDHVSVALDALAELRRVIREEVHVR